MQLYNLKYFKRGWFTGKFDPTIYSSDFEVGVQNYIKGQTHDKHYHKEATEINVITKGECCFTFYDSGGKSTTERIIAKEGDIVVIEPNEITKFHATEDCCVTVVKTKSIQDDKYKVK
jgi:quercetin dioxygenase-like cupin family protein